MVKTQKNKMGLEKLIHVKEEVDQQVPQISAELQAFS
jgi:hypothetical protein